MSATRFYLGVPAFTSPSAYEVDSTVGGLVRFTTYRGGDDDDTHYEVSTEVGGSCTVTIDDRLWSGQLTCTGLLDNSRASETAEVGPVDLTVSWECSGRNRSTCELTEACPE